MVLMEKFCFPKNDDNIDTKYHWKIEWIGQVLVETKCCNLINIDLEEKDRKFKKNNNFTCHDYLP